MKTRDYFVRALGARGALWLALLALVLLASFGCARISSGGGQGLLAGKMPSKSENVTSVERITNGEISHPGSDWNSNRTSIFSPANAFVEYDLGSDQRIVGAALFADNNDNYDLSVSSDGASFRPVWTAAGVAGSGMRWRTTDTLDTSARFVRLVPGRGGDTSLSVGELVLYGEKPAAMPPALREVSSVPAGLAFRNALLIFATAVSLTMAFSYRGAAVGWNAILLLVAVGSAWPVITSFIEASPIESLEVSLTRGVVAAIAGVVVMREAFGPSRYPAQGRLAVGILSVMSVASVMAFYNLGRPQFYDARENHPSVVHNYDMRVYYPVAKYFKELKYDGLYLASAATYAEEHGGVDRPTMLRVELRDLRNHRMRKVQDVREEVINVKNRFSPERWAELKEDMRYFWETMGQRGYLGSMSDHGGNATPLWLAITHIMFASTKASNAVLLWGGLLDPLMLVGLFVAIWRSFGVRTALVCMVVFGANDFYMFGSNWAGATLRHDWMVYLGLGACALKKEHYKLGGALLALSALIRAFPAISLVALAVPVGWWIYERQKKTGKWPSPKEIIENNRWFLDAAIGAAIAIAAAVLFSSIVLGFDAWPLWVKKISSFTSDPHVNHVSLLTVTSGSEGNQAMVRASRMPFHVAATALYVGLAIWAARRAKPQQVALLGMMMMPVLMYPANYYIHFIFVLPMLVDERPKGEEPRVGEWTAKIWLLLLGLCAAQYFTVKEKELDVHFYNASVLLMATLLAMLVVLVQRGLHAPTSGSENSPLPEEKEPAPQEAAAHAPDGVLPSEPAEA